MGIGKPPSAWDLQRAARLDRGRRCQGHGVALEGAAKLPATDEEGQGLDCVSLPCRDQHKPGLAGGGRVVQRSGRQGRGQPSLAEGEGRLGRLENAVP